MHKIIGRLADAVHATIPYMQRAAQENQDWREMPEAAALRQEVMNVNVARGHAAALLLDDEVARAVERLGDAAFPLYMTMRAGWDDDARAEFYNAIDDALAAISLRIRALYGLPSPRPDHPPR